MTKMILLVILSCVGLLNAEIRGADMTLWKADCYDENSRLQQTIAKNFLDLLQKQFQLKETHSQLLDVGCGTGRITQLILESFPGIYIQGVDASKEMVDFANQHFASSKAVFSVDRAEELKSIDSGSMDAITSFSCLHWVHEQQAAFQAMHRVLKPGGWIGLMFAADTGFDDPIDHAYAQAIQEAPWNTYFKQPKQDVEWNLVGPEKIKSQLEESGFQVVFLAVQNWDFPFKDIRAFESWILGCFQQLKLLPIDLQVSCSHRIAELYLQSTSSRQPKLPQCVFQVDALMVMAIKR